MAECWQRAGARLTWGLRCAPAAVMEMAAGGSLTSYVADKWQKAQAQGLFLSEDEARFFFKARRGVRVGCPSPACSCSPPRRCTGP